MDDSKCKESVMWDSWHSRQCTRKIWNDGFCKQHHPETVKERQKESQRKWEERRKKEPWYLLKIAQERIAELEAEVARLSTLNAAAVGRRGSDVPTSGLLADESKGATR